MIVKPIRTEHDYQQALQRVQELWASPCCSPERDELNALEALLEAYEDEHYPMDSPGAAGDDDKPQRSMRQSKRLSGRGDSRG